jgi:hypothetical protein
MKMIMEKQMECRLAGETEVLGENLPQRHFCPAELLIDVLMMLCQLYRSYLFELQINILGLL